MTLGSAPNLQLTVRAARTKVDRPEVRSRLRGRTIEFAGVLLIAASLAGAGVTMVRAAFARPLTAVADALAR